MVLFTVLSSLFEATMCQLNFLIEAGQGNPSSVIIISVYYAEGRATEVYCNRALSSAVTLIGMGLHIVASSEN